MNDLTQTTLLNHHQVHEFKNELHALKIGIQLYRQERDRGVCGLETYELILKSIDQLENQLLDQRTDPDHSGQ